MTNHQSQRLPSVGQQRLYESAISNPHTLKTAFERSGRGLHSGSFTNVRVLPAKAGEGRYFVRVDLPGTPIIPARVEAVH